MALIQVRSHFGSRMSQIDEEEQRIEETVESTQGRPIPINHHLASELFISLTLLGFEMGTQMPTETLPKAPTTEVLAKAMEGEGSGQVATSQQFVQQFKGAPQVPLIAQEATQHPPKSGAAESVEAARSDGQQQSQGGGVIQQQAPAPLPKQLAPAMGSPFSALVPPPEKSAPAPYASGFIEQQQQAQVAYLHHQHVQAVKAAASLGVQPAATPPGQVMGVEYYGLNNQGPQEFDQSSELTQPAEDIGSIHAKLDNLIAAVTYSSDANQSRFDQLQAGQQDLTDTLVTTTATLAAMSGVSALSMEGGSSYAKALGMVPQGAEVPIQLTPHGYAIATKAGH